MMDKYMQTAKEMLVLIDEFDKEDVFDMDKTIQSESYNLMRSVYIRILY